MNEDEAAREIRQALESRLGARKGESHMRIIKTALSVVSTAMLTRTIVFNDVEMESTEQGRELVFPEPVFMSKDEEILVRYDPDAKELTLEVYTWVVLPPVSYLEIKGSCVV